VTKKWIEIDKIDHTAIAGTDVMITFFCDYVFANFQRKKWRFL
jgi:hypothetical protein